MSKGEKEKDDGLTFEKHLTLKAWRTWKPEKSSILCHLVSFTGVEWGDEAFHGESRANWV